VWSLVAVPIVDLDTPLLTYLVALDESLARQVIQRLVDVHVVVSQQLGLELPRPIQQSPVAISNGP